jgi:hypothetical protein
MESLPREAWKRREAEWTLRRSGEDRFGRRTVDGYAVEASGEHEGELGDEPREGRLPGKENGMARHVESIETDGGQRVRRYNG